MRKFIGFGVVALSIAFAGTALASGEDIFKSKCLPCHGVGGAGTAMAPAFKANDWLKKATDDEVGAVVGKGRAGAAKMYKNFALDMPPQPLTPDEINAIVHYIKGIAAQ